MSSHRSSEIKQVSVVEVEVMEEVELEVMVEVEVMKEEGSSWLCSWFHPDQLSFTSGLCDQDENNVTDRDQAIRCKQSVSWFCVNKTG